MEPPVRLSDTELKFECALYTIAKLLSSCTCRRRQRAELGHAPNIK